MFCPGLASSLAYIYVLSRLDWGNPWKSFVRTLERETVCLEREIPGLGMCDLNQVGGDDLYSFGL
ncbi:hypothetical protein HanRHA438_Chr17g0809731 [Helianthus annuus]|nr:hypothetical protein HanIR_Chr17g0867231 [Helianthus annuus]KAJ0826036.1 hypothetical protein HanRHA438_Chr17g0809731 [Helianthus annuus]